MLSSRLRNLDRRPARVLRMLLVLGVVLATATAGLEAARADWLSRIARIAENAGSKGAGTIERAAGKLKAVPTGTNGAALAAHASPEGHWTFVNSAGERFTAGTADEMKRVAAMLAPATEQTGGALALVVTEDTLFTRARHLKALPANAKLWLSTGTSAHPVVTIGTGSAQRLYVETRPGLLVAAAERAGFEEAQWQLARSLKRAHVRVLALEAGGPHTLRSSPAIDDATKRAITDRIDPERLPGALRSIAGQTAVVTGRVQGGSLYVRMASGLERTIPIDALTAAAAKADVNLVVLNSPAPRQPGQRNWLWQRAAVDGLDDALGRATMADFVVALGRGETRFTVSVTASGGRHVRLSAVPDGGEVVTIPGLSGILPEIVSELAGKVVTSGIEASLTSAERQRELDARLIPGIPSDIQIAYGLCMLLGLAGLGLVRGWWSRIWPPEQRSSYSSRIGYEAARVTRLVLLALVFLPLSGPIAGPLAIARNALETLLGALIIVTWPLRALVRMLSRSRV